jgi:hypothetical protein
MDFLRFANWGSVNERGYLNGAVIAPSNTDYEDLSTVLQDAHLRKDIARRADLTPFVRDEALDQAA